MQAAAGRRVGGAEVVVPVQVQLAGGLHAVELRREDGSVLGREVGAVLALDVARDRLLVGAVLLVQRVDSLQDHLRKRPRRPRDGERAARARKN